MSPMFRRELRHQLQAAQSLLAQALEDHDPWMVSAACSRVTELREIAGRNDVVIPGGCH